MAELTITLNRSVIGHPQNQKDTVRALGLKRMHHTIVVPDNPSIRGMLHTVRHLVRVHADTESGVES